MEPLKIAVVGAGRRGTGVWIPVAQALNDRATLVAICNRGAPRGKEAAENASVPHFTNVETMLTDIEPHIVVAAVKASDMLDVSLPTLERGISIIHETPIAATLEEADRFIETAHKSGAHLEVAENFYRMPVERLKGHMLAEGVFGNVWRSFNDHRTHNYHAISMIRSYIGFDIPIKRVTGWQQHAPVAEHQFRNNPIQQERARHAVIEFENGALGFHGFSSLSLGSPIRDKGKHTGFYAERGMAFGDDLTLLTDPDQTQSLTIERTMETVNGQKILKSVHAGDWSWHNPYFEHGIPENHVALASTLDKLIQAICENKQPEYGARNGRVDREVDLAITQSHEAGNIPIELPL